LTDLESRIACIDQRLISGTPNGFDESTLLPRTRLLLSVNDALRADGRHDMAEHLAGHLGLYVEMFDAPHSGYSPMNPARSLQDRARDQVRISRTMEAPLEAVVEERAIDKTLFVLRNAGALLRMRGANWNLSTTAVLNGINVLERLGELDHAAALAFEVAVPLMTASGFDRWPDHEEMGPSPIVWTSESPGYQCLS
jgi:hypothetical protein